MFAFSSGISKENYCLLAAKLVLQICPTLELDETDLLFLEDTLYHLGLLLFHPQI
jgi:hypothetical protein